MAPILRPIWRRAWVRIENRVAVAETRVAPVDARLAALEAAWRQHVPSFLNAVGSVSAFAHELARTQREVAAQPGRLREEFEDSRRAVEGKLERAAEEAGRLRDEVAARVGEEVGRLRDEVASRAAEEAGRLRDEVTARVGEEVGRLRDEVASRLAEEREHAAAALARLEPLAERLEQDGRRLDQVDASIRAIWERSEFIRREILFEMRYGGGDGGGDRPSKPDAAPVAPRIVAVEKVAAARAAGALRLNIGCGHIALPDYVNVDMRELPGVDVVAEVGDLPFEPGSLDEIHSAHLLEHFPQEDMRRRLLPYWRRLLRPGGTFRAVTPDAAAMLSAAGAGGYPFEDFREVVFGAQDYAGDFHYNLFTPDSLGALLAETGFEGIEVPVAGRRNGKCFEFEIAARRP